VKQKGWDQGVPPTWEREKVKGKQKVERVTGVG